MLSSAGKGPEDEQAWVAKIHRKCVIASEPARESRVAGGGETIPQAAVNVPCRACGKEVDTTKKFCRHCGTSLPPPVAASVVAPTLCPNCSASLPAGKKFCKKCGYRLTPTSVEEGALTTTPEPTMFRPMAPATPPATSAVAALPAHHPALPFVVPEVKRPSGPVITVKPPPPATVSEKLPSASAVHGPEPIELPDTATTETTKRKLLYWLGGAIITVGLAGLFAWFLFWTPEARLFRAADRGDLVTPEGSSAYDYYKQIKARGLTSTTRNKLKVQVFPKLLSTGDAVLQKRSEGTSMKRAEFRELANLYEFAADLAPDDPKVLSRHYYTQGTLALLDGRLQAALQSIKQSVDYDPNWAPAFNDLGKVYVRLNDYYHAEETYEKAIQAQPNWVFPQLNLAGIYLHNKEWPRAEQAYVKAVELDKTLATTWYFLGQVYEAEARPPDAINAYEHAIELAASRPSSAFRVDVVQNRVLKLRRKMAGGSR